MILARNCLIKNTNSSAWREILHTNHCWILMADFLTTKALQSTTSISASMQPYQITTDLTHHVIFPIEMWTIHKHTLSSDAKDQKTTAIIVWSLPSLVVILGESDSRFDVNQFPKLQLSLEPCTQKPVIFAIIGDGSYPRCRHSRWVDAFNVSDPFWRCKQSRADEFLQLTRLAVRFLSCCNLAISSEQFCTSLSLFYSTIQKGFRTRIWFACRALVAGSSYSTLSYPLRGSHGCQMDITWLAPRCTDHSRGGSSVMR